MGVLDRSLSRRRFGRAAAKAAVAAPLAAQAAVFAASEAPAAENVAPAMDGETATLSVAPGELAVTQASGRIAGVNVEALAAQVRAVSFGDLRGFLGRWMPSYEVDAVMRQLEREAAGLPEEPFEKAVVSGRALTAAEAQLTVSVEPAGPNMERLVLGRVETPPRAALPKLPSRIPSYQWRPLPALGGRQ
jgi:hypothetical protein